MKKTNKKTDLGKSILSRNQKILFSFLLVFVFGLGFGAKASAAIYNGVTYTEVFYLCVGGNSSAPTDGTCANAWSATDFNTAAKWAATDTVDSKLGPNDALVVLDDGGSFSGSILQTRASGLSGKQITIIGETGGTPTISGAGVARALYVPNSYVTVDNLTISGGTGQAFYFLSGTGNILRNSTVIGDNNGVTMSGVTSALISNVTASTVTGYAVHSVNCTTTTIEDLTVTSSSGTALYMATPVSMTVNRLRTNHMQQAGVLITFADNSSVIGNDWQILDSGLAGTGVRDGIFVDGASKSNIHFVLTDLTLTTSFQHGLYITNASFDSTSELNGFDISYANVQNIYLRYSPNFKIKNGRSHHAVVDDGIMFFESPNVLIEHNEIDYNGRDGISSDDNSTNAIVRYNDVHNNGQQDLTGNGDGITAHNGCTGHQYYNNLVYENRNSGFATIEGSSGVAYNNAVVNNGDSASTNMGVRAGFYNGDVSAWTIKNNIFQGNYPNEFRGDTSGIGSLTADYNAFYHSGNNITTQPTIYKSSTSTGYTLAEWQVAYNQDMHSISSNPFLVSVTNFRLQNTSPAINAGTDVGLTTDYEGNPKSGPNFDIGAYEFQDSTNPTTTADVDTGLYNSVQTVTLTCNDGSGVGCDKTYYTTDGTDPDTDSNQYSTPLVISSTTTLKFFSQDRNENSETPIKSKTYTIDTTFPQTSIDSNPDALINTNSATFTFSASETATFQCKMDSGAYSSCASPKNYTSLAEGAHTFYVKATDTATNEDATPANYAFTVDTEVPTISNLSPNNATLSVITTSTNLTLTTSETTTCKYSTISGTSYASMTAFDITNNTTHSTAIAGLNSGTTYDYYILCKDAINESAEAHLTFFIRPVA